MEEELSKIKCGRATVKLGGRKVLCLAYADDVVLMAEKENEIRSILEKLKWYVVSGKDESNEIQEKWREVGKKVLKIEK